MNESSPNISRELREDLATVDAKGDVTDVAAKLGIITPAGIEFLRNVMANALLMDRKQRDYGSRNISRFGASGCIVRMSDKFERMINLYNNRRRKAQNESIIDSWRDFSNYGIIGQMCEMNKWPDV
jgi:hypothetical protein